VHPRSENPGFAYEADCLEIILSINWHEFVPGMMSIADVSFS